MFEGMRPCEFCYGFAALYLCVRGNAKAVSAILGYASPSHASSIPVLVRIVGECGVLNPYMCRAGLEIV